MGEEIYDTESIVHINEKELALLLISSIQTLKRSKKKCGREELYGLLKESVETEISPESFHETLNLLVENGSVIINTFRNRECISLPKENFQETELEKEDKCEQVESSFMEEFNDFKAKFLLEVKQFKDSFF